MNPFQYQDKWFLTLGPLSTDLLVGTGRQQDIFSPSRSSIFYIGKHPRLAIHSTSMQIQIIKMIFNLNLIRKKHV